MVRIKFIHTVLSILLLLPVLASSVGNENITTPLPDSNTQTFRPDSRAMWQNEPAAVMGRYFPTDWVYSGGLHATSTTCTSAAFATEAFTSPTTVGARSERVRAKSDGTGGTVAIDYSLVGANCANPGSDVARVSACSISANSTGNWQRVTGSNYFVNTVDTTPNIPAGCAGLMDLIITNGAIVNVASIAKHAPIPGAVAAPAGIAKNVKECGAMVDGIADDTVAINNCLATYPHVFVPAGTLKHSGTIVINVGNWLDGVWQGPDASTLAHAGTIPVVPGTYLHYTGAGAAIELEMPSIRECQCRISNLTLYAAGGTQGIHFKNMVQVFIDYVDVVGITFPATTQGFSIAGIHLEQSLNSTDFIGLVYITHSDVRYTAGYGILIDGGNNLNSIHISHTQVQGNGLQGVRIAGYAQAMDFGGNTLQGNGCDAPAGVGYQFYSFYSAGLTFHGNYVEACAAVTGSPPVQTRNDPPVRFERGTGITVTGGIINGGVGNQTCGIHLGTSASGYVPQGVTIQGVTFATVDATVCIEMVRGFTYLGNVCWFDCTTELGGSFAVAQGFNFQEMTRDIIGGQPASVFTGTPTIFCHINTVYTVANTVAEGGLYACVIPAHTLENAAFLGGIDFVLHGGLANLSGGPADYTFRVKLGAVTFAVHRFSAVANAGGVYPWVLTGNLLGSSAGANHQTGWVKTELGAINAQISTVVDTGVTTRFNGIYNGLAGVNPAVSNTLAITVEMSLAHATTTTFAENGRVMRLPY